MRLTEEAKQALKADIASGTMSNFALADKYNIDLTTVRSYKNPEYAERRAKNREIKRKSARLSANP